MFGIIVSGHGGFATGLEETIELVLGKQEKVAFVNFSEGMNLDDLNTKFEEKIKEVAPNNEAVLFLTDLIGGTPFSTAVSFKAKYPSIEVISGCNFPMLITAIDLRDDESLEDSLDEILENARAGIQVFKVENTSENSELNEEEDGI